MHPFSSLNLPLTVHFCILPTVLHSWLLLNQAPVRSGPEGGRLKVAVQILSTFMVTCPSVQSESPLQPTKVAPLAGVGVKVTPVPLL